MALIDSMLNGMISDQQKILIEMIIHESKNMEVDPVLAVSMAILESALNPNAIGDSGTSFGLYQLHEGGELGNMTAEEAFNPVTNTRVALKVLHIATLNNPGQSPGNIASAAQRPAFPGVYAMAVNAMYPMVKKLLASLGVYNG
jgi:soluble lytic murein transglycosylase-like protein